ncbi:MAG: ribonuclease Z [Alphaproteobacteria bacterium]|nr:ribonuclease Z [Alphaproteobacteria bacterium]
MRRFFLGVIALAALAGGAAYAFRGEIALALMQRTLNANFAGDPIAELPDGLHIGLCGAGAPMPAADRSGPCVAVVAGKRLIVIDAGTGGVRTLARMRLPPGRIERVLLTHFHSDHIDGLGEMMLQRWVGAANAAPLPVHGPAGIESVVDGFNAAYGHDKGYRVAHHGEAVVPPSGFGGTAVPFALDSNGNAIVLDDGGLTIEAFKVEHAPIEPAVGYRITYKGRTAVISGDTKKSRAVEQRAAGVDLLVHEALSPKLVGMIGNAAKAGGQQNITKIMHDILDYHTTPEEAAGIAARAKVKVLLLYHIVPPLPVSALEGPFLGTAREIYTGPLYVGRDGDFVTMPAGSTEVRFTNRL